MVLAMAIRCCLEMTSAARPARCLRAPSVCGVYLPSLLACHQGCACRLRRGWGRVCVWPSACLTHNVPWVWVLLGAGQHQTCSCVHALVGTANVLGDNHRLARGCMQMHGCRHPPLHEWDGQSWLCNGLCTLPSHGDWTFGCNLLGRLVRAPTARLAGCQAGSQCTLVCSVGSVTDGRVMVALMERHCDLKSRRIT